MTYWAGGCSGDDDPRVVPSFRIERPRRIWSLGKSTTGRRRHLRGCYWSQIFGAWRLEEFKKVYLFIDCEYNTILRRWQLYGPGTPYFGGWF